MKVCIVGGGGGASNAANVIRSLDKDAKIDIFTIRNEIGYVPCEIPFVLRGIVPSWEDSFAFREKFYQQRNITVHYNTEVTDIFRKEKRLVAGGHTCDYDKVILDLGGYPTVPRIPGLDGWNELVLSTDLRYARVLEETISKYRCAAIIGAGMIGLEIAEVLLEKNYGTIYVLDILENALGLLLDKETAEVIEKRIKDRKVELILPAMTESIASREGKKIVSLADRKLEVDFVLFATGSMPNVELARKAGIEVGDTGAIAVNEYLQTSDPDIYAIGDCMENSDAVRGSKILYQTASNTARSGKIAATNLTMGNILPYKGTTMTFITEIFGYQVGAVGFTESYARNNGFDVCTSMIKTATKRRVFGGKPIHIKLIADRSSHTLIGGQVISEESVAAQIDKLSVAIAEKIPVERLSLIDTCYSPPVNTAYAPLTMALDNIRW